MTKSRRRQIQLYAFSAATAAAAVYALAAPYWAAH